MKEKPTFLHPIVIIGFFGGVTLAKKAGSSKKSRKALLLLLLLIPLDSTMILKVEHAVNLGLCLMCILYRHSEFCMGCKAAFALSAKWMTHAKTQPAAQPRDISR